MDVQVEKIWRAGRSGVRRLRECRRSTAADDQHGATACLRDTELLCIQYSVHDRAALGGERFPYFLQAGKAVPLAPARRFRRVVRIPRQQGPIAAVPISDSYAGRPCQPSMPRCSPDALPVEQGAAQSLERAASHHDQRRKTWHGGPATRTFACGKSTGENLRTSPSTVASPAARRLAQACRSPSIATAGTPRLTAPFALLTNRTLPPPLARAEPRTHPVSTAYNQ